MVDTDLHKKQTGERHATCVSLLSPVLRFCRIDGLNGMEIGRPQPNKGVLYFYYTASLGNNGGFVVNESPSFRESDIWCCFSREKSENQTDKSSKTLIPCGFPLLSLLYRMGTISPVPPLWRRDFSCKYGTFKMICKSAPSSLTTGRPVLVLELSILAGILCRWICT